MMKTLKLGRIESILTLIFILGIFGLTAWLLEQNPKRWDVTMAGEYTLSDETVRLLRQLNGKIEIIAFFQPEQKGRRRAKHLLDTYGYASDKIHYRFVDPDRDPALARKYEIKGYGQLVLIYDGREERISYFTEQDITNGIAKLLQGKMRIAYFLTGHGERDPEEFGPEGYSRLKHAIEQQNYQIRMLSLVSTDQVPSDAAVVVIAGPRKKLFPEELTLLNEYLESGGALLVMLDSGFDGNLREFLSSKNIVIQDDLIVDKGSNVLGGDYLMPVITKFSDHEITKNSTTATIMYEARSVRSKKGKGWISRDLAWSSGQSWAETDLKSASNERLAVFEEGQDMTGPVSVAAVGVKLLPELKTPGGGLGADSRALQTAAATGNALKKCHVVVIGDSDFAKNAFFDLAGDSEFALNAINFLARSPEMISIRPRSRETSPLILTYTEAKWLFWHSFAFMPGMILLSGLAAWIWKRRRR